MAIVLPATYPVRFPDRALLAGQPHASEDVQAVVEGCNFQIGYQRMSQMAQSWDAGEVRSTTVGAWDRVLVWTFRQYLSATRGSYFSFIWQSDPAAPNPAFQFRILCMETGLYEVAATNVIGPGATAGQYAAAALLRSDAVSTLALELNLAAGTTWADVRSLHLRDRLLTVATMP